MLNLFFSSILVNNPENPFSVHSCNPRICFLEFIFVQDSHFPKNLRTRFPGNFENCVSQKIPRFHGNPEIVFLGEFRDPVSRQNYRRVCFRQIRVNPFSLKIHNSCSRDIPEFECTWKRIKWHRKDDPKKWSNKRYAKNVPISYTLYIYYMKNYFILKVHQKTSLK